MTMMQLCMEWVGGRQVMLVELLQATFRLSRDHRAAAALPLILRLGLFGARSQELSIGHDCTARVVV